MQKITVALDGLDYKESVVEFAISLVAHTHAHLTGVFLHDPIYHSYKIYDMASGRMMTNDEIDAKEDEDKELRKSSKQLFEEACALHHTQHKVRECKDIALQGLAHESIYSDMIVIHSGEQFTHYHENKPSAFIRNFLELTKSPVILVPDEATPIRKAIFLYDGTPESMHAIKMFSYCMSDYANLSIEVLSVNDENDSPHLKDNELLKEYLKRHYPKAVYSVIKGQADRKIIAALKKEPLNTIVVLGAYNRGMVSRWFKPSMADILLSALRLPLFVAPSR